MICFSGLRKEKLKINVLMAFNSAPLLYSMTDPIFLSTLHIFLKVILLFLNALLFLDAFSLISKIVYTFWVFMNWAANKILFSFSFWRLFTVLHISYTVSILLLRLSILLMASLNSMFKGTLQQWVYKYFLLNHRRRSVKSVTTYLLRF